MGRPAVPVAIFLALKSSLLHHQVNRAEHSRSCVVADMGLRGGKVDVRPGLLEVPPVALVHGRGMFFSARFLSFAACAGGSLQSG